MKYGYELKSKWKGIQQGMFTQAKVWTFSQWVKNKREKID